MLALRVWKSFVRVRWGLRRKALPVFVHELGQTSRDADRHSAAGLSRAVDRSLRVGSLRPRCLIAALVLYRLLREQGDEPELVIGLPHDPRDHLAHAWVEMAGEDVGPPPGRGTHTTMARYS